MSSQTNKLDSQFVAMLTKIEEKYLKFNRHIQIRIEKWVQELVQCDGNLVWKKSRNMYLQLLEEMVDRNWVGAMFIKMPPPSGIPNLTDSEFKMIMLQIKKHQKEDAIGPQMGIQMKQVAEPFGDQGSFSVTPNCQTDREICEKKDILVLEPSTIREVLETQPMEPIFEQPKPSQTILLYSVGKFLSKYEKCFKESQEFRSIQSTIKDCLEGRPRQKTCEEQSSEFQVREGIERNKLNLFQFGSPRGQTQMQYFKATLQL